MRVAEYMILLAMSRIMPESTAGICRVRSRMQLPELRQPLLDRPGRLWDFVPPVFILFVFFNVVFCYFNFLFFNISEVFLCFSLCS